MPGLCHVLIFALLFVYGSIARGHATPSVCNCYLTSGRDKGFYSHYSFWNFTHVPSERGNDFTVAPLLVSSLNEIDTSAVSSSFFNSPAWKDNWQISTYVQEAARNFPIERVFVPQNVYISRNTTAADESTYLTLRANRAPGFVATAEIESTVDDIVHCSIRARLRVIANALAIPDSSSTGSNRSQAHSHLIEPGAVVGFFTYHSDDEEADIELLTGGPTNHVWYTNQPSLNPSDNDIPGATTDFVMPSHLSWSEWIDYRLDWVNTATRWYLNDELALSKTINVPTKPSSVILNAWSDGGTWSGNMTIGSQVIVGVEWIEMAFNTTSAASSRACTVGCRIDGVRKKGVPELAFNTTANASPMMRGQPSFTLLFGALIFCGAILFCCG